jgi:uncharacterized membrane protein YeiB
LIDEPSSARIIEIDAVRGMALFGICIVNTVQMTGVRTVAGSGHDNVAHWAYETALHQRFFPIFSFLFGLSFGIFLRAAGRRTSRPRLVMLARLGFLTLFGALHQLLQPGEVLLTYGVIGAAVLLPASFLDSRVILILGAVLTAAGVAAGGGTVLIPGTFLLGLAVADIGIRDIVDSSTRRLALAVTGCCALAALLNTWQIWAEATSGSALAAGAGVITGAAYTLVLILLFRSRIRRALGGLALVGRMALTGYIGATLLIIAADRLMDIGPDSGYGVAVAVGGFIFAVEMAFSWAWLRYARYGPLEWIWRCVTWWELAPNRSRRKRVTS